MFEKIMEFVLSGNGRICLLALLFMTMFFAEVSLVNLFALGVHAVAIWSIYALSQLILTQTNVYLFIFFVLVSTYLYIKRSIQFVPSRPACVGLIKILGKKTETYCTDGTKFYPLSPLFSIEPIAIQPIAIDSETEVVLPDGTKARLPSKLTISPNKRHLKTFIEKGEVEGIKKILISRIEPVLRIWASSDEEGPADWREARAAGADVTARIAKPLLGKCLDDIPSAIPTPCLLRYFTVPRPKPSKKDSDQFGPSWEKLTDALKTLTPQQLSELKEAVANRRKQIFELSQVQGNFEDDNLGIIIHGYSLGRIQILGGVEEAAASKVREQEEGQGSIAEFNVDMQKAKALMDAVNAIPGAKKISLDGAYRLISEQRAIKESPQSHAIVVSGLTDMLGRVLDADTLEKILKIIEASKK